jgi:PAS domain S-box-containing protein
MKTGSITFKLLALVVGASLLTTVLVLVVANDKLTRIIDQSQNAMYTEKLNVLWSVLGQADERLRRTGWIEAYAEDFQNSAVKSIRDSYYGQQNQPVYPFILDTDGRVVLHPVLPAGDASLMSHADIKRMTQAGRGDFIARCTGQKTWCVYRRFDAWDWVLGYTVPLDMKYADARSFRTELLWVMTAVSLLVLLLLSLILARFTKPIVTLTHLSSQIADGHLNQPIDLRGKDEVATLARSFNHMRDSIKQQIADLNHEIEERKQAERRLQRNEENLRITLHSIGDGVIATDTGGRIIRMNPVAEKLSGWAFSEACGQPLHDVLKLVDAVTREPIENPLENVFCSWKMEELPEKALLIARDGSEYQIANSGAPIRSDTGDMLGLVLVIRDVTREHALQESLKQSQKMDAIGQLAGGVAHDFNNMLSGILGSAELLEDFLPDDPTVRQFHSIILESATRAASLTQKLLSFSRKRPAASTVIDVHSVLQDAVTLMKSSLDRRIQLITELNAKYCLVAGDPVQLQNAFLNLGINAAHALPKGGTIRIRTANVHIDKATRDGGPLEVQPGPHLEIDVCDTGSGIAPQDLPRIFEPFFTTRQQGKGTGLGLASVFGTVQQHRGLITASNQPTGGARFRILLPLTNEPLNPSSPAAAPHVEGSGTVLVVDDEKSLRMTARAILQELGYTVLLAENGRQALDLFSADPSAIDLVLLDMVMPQMNGRDCFDAMQKIDPDVRVILASGFAQEKDIEQMTAAGLRGFLAKPYRMADLSRMIHAALS